MEIERRPRELRRPLALLLAGTLLATLLATSSSPAPQLFGVPEAVDAVSRGFGLGSLFNSVMTGGKIGCDNLPASPTLLLEDAGSAADSKELCGMAKGWTNCAVVRPDTEVVRCAQAGHVLGLMKGLDFVRVNVDGDAVPLDKQPGYKLPVSIDGGHAEFSVGPAGSAFGVVHPAGASIFAIQACCPDGRNLLLEMPANTRGEGRE